MLHFLFFSLPLEISRRNIFHLLFESILVFSYQLPPYWYQMKSRTNIFQMLCLNFHFPETPMYHSSIGFVRPILFQFSGQKLKTPLLSNQFQNYCYSLFVVNSDSYCFQELQRNPHSCHSYLTQKSHPRSTQIWFPFSGQTKPYRFHLLLVFQSSYPYRLLLPNG